MKSKSFLYLFCCFFLFGSIDVLSSAQKEQEVVIDANGLTEMIEQINTGNNYTQETQEILNILLGEVTKNNYLLEKQAKDSKRFFKKVAYVVGSGALVIGGLFLAKCLMESGAAESLLQTSDVVASTAENILSSSTDRLVATVMESQEGKSFVATCCAMLMAGGFAGTKMLLSCGTKISLVATKSGLSSALYLITNPSLIVPLFTVISTKAWNKDCIKNRIPERLHFLLEYLDKASDKMMALVWGGVGNGGNGINEEDVNNLVNESVEELRGEFREKFKNQEEKLNKNIELLYDLISKLSEEICCLIEKNDENSEEINGLYCSLDDIITYRIDDYNYVLDSMRDHFFEHEKSKESLIQVIRVFSVLAVASVSILNMLNLQGNGQWLPVQGSIQVLEQTNANQAIMEELSKKDTWKAECAKNMRCMREFRQKEVYLRNHSVSFNRPIGKRGDPTTIKAYPSLITLRPAQTMTLQGCWKK